MLSRTKLLALVGCGFLLTIGAGSAAATQYKPAGPYANLAKRPGVTDAPPGQGGPFKIDKKRGIAGVGQGPPTYSAASDAWHGLWSYTKWLQTGKRQTLTNVKLAARWIKAKMDPDGLYRVNTGYDFGLERPLVLEPGWYGGLSQAMAASLLTRLYKVTRNRRYLDLALRGLEPLSRPIESGGVTSKFLGTGLPFFEAYATLPVRAHTLTHHAFTLIGLYDASRYSAEAARLFREGMSTLVYALPFYEIGDRAAVWLLHVTDPPRPVDPISGWSQEVMLPALQDLQSVAPNATLAFYIRKWERQLGAICENPLELCYFHGPAKRERAKKEPKRKS